MLDSKKLRDNESTKKNYNTMVNYRIEKTKATNKKASQENTDIPKERREEGFPIGNTKTVYKERGEKKLSATAKIKSAITKDNSVTFGSLKTLDGRFTQINKNKLRLLMNTHFLIIMNHLPKEYELLS